jgi:hypothetical protein
MARGGITYGESELIHLSRKVLPEVRKKEILSKDSWVRVSSLAFLCAREEALCVKYGIIREEEISADLSVIFEHGHALHWALQNRILPRLGAFYGRWRCAVCGAAYGGRDRPWVFGTFTAEEFVASQVQRPSVCASCDSELDDSNSLYIEPTFHNNEFKLSGHSDGFLVIPGLDGMGLLEAKSINPKGAAEVRLCPKLDHVIQAHCYMWLTGLRWAKILYWDKAGSGIRSLVEHTIEYDEDTIFKVRDLLTTLREDLASPDLPSKICQRRTCDRAKACDAVDYCFSEVF